VLTYVLRRFAAVFPVLIGVSLLVFIGIHLIPGDPAQILLGDKGTPQELEQLRRDLGLDQPIYVQYWRFLRRAVTGDFGRSLRTKQPVWHDIAASLPSTIELSAAAILLATTVAIPAGVLVAVRRNSILDHGVMVAVLIGISMPVFWTGLLLMLLVGVMMPIFPLSGVLDDGVVLSKITGMYLVDSLLQSNWVAFRSALLHLALPTITLATIPTAVIARMTRSAMLEVLGQDYIRTARAKGLAERIVNYRHALKNALIPVVTVVGLQFGNLLSGAVITETVFARPGMGRLAVISILFRDYPVVEGVVLVVATLFVLLNLATDLLYAIIDPRVHYT